MGRGQGRGGTKLEHLAHAWLYAIFDPITGINQSAVRFKTTMFENIFSFSPPYPNKKSYERRTVKSVGSDFNEISADIQKFSNALHRVNTSSSSGGTEDEVLSVSIAIHFGKRAKIYYEAKKIPSHLVEESYCL